MTNKQNSENRPVIFENDYTKHYTLLFKELGKELAKGLPDDIIQQARQHNAWFTVESINKATKALSVMLQPAALHKWLRRYAIPVEQPKRVGIVMAGNLPMVGFHDLMCVLISGHVAVAKLSSQDTVLMQYLLHLIRLIDPQTAERAEFVPQLKGVDAYIATGSNNSARYFEYYFSKKPSIIRKNRTSAAVIIGNETTEQLEALGEDVFSYFGLGCRNVCKLYVPEKYDFNNLLDAWQKYRDVINMNKYFNNYEYHKAIYLVNGDDHLDTGFVLLIENEGISSPPSVIYHQKYSSLAEAESLLQAHEEQWQCIICAEPDKVKGAIPPGYAQTPALWQYADNIDTMTFLTRLSVG